MPKPVCVPCGLFFRTKKIGITIEERMPLHDGSWGPYKLWRADLYECHGCGAEMATGFGFAPIVEHYEQHYNDVRAAMPIVMTVDNG